MVKVNEVSIPFNFVLDDSGYIHPNKPSSEMLEKFGLKEGKNVVEFSIGVPNTPTFGLLTNEVYLYSNKERLVVSDVDGTLTRSDVEGIYNNYHGRDFLHDSYADLMRVIQAQGYQVVWMTMRSLPMYNMSK